MEKNKSIVDLFVEKYKSRFSQYEESPINKPKKKKVKVKEKEPTEEFKIPEVEPEQTTQPLVEVEKEKEEKKEPGKGKQRELVYGPAPEIERKPDFTLRQKESPPKMLETDEIVPVKETKKKGDEIEQFKRNLPSKEFQRHIVPVKYEENAPPPFGLVETKDTAKSLSMMEEVWEGLRQQGVSEKEIEEMKKKYEETGKVSFDLELKHPSPFGNAVAGFAVRTEGKTPEEVWKEIESLLRASRVPQSEINRAKKEFMRSGEVIVTSLPINIGKGFRKLPK